MHASHEKTPAKRGRKPAPSVALPRFQRAPRQTLHDHAYGELRRALMTGRFVPGQKVTVRGLAAAFGISPTPIREAVRRLGAEGALQLEANRWMRVPLLSRHELQELRAIRVALEGLATEVAASHITREELQALRIADAAIRALRGTGRTADMIVQIHRFHHTIYAAARMPALKHLIEGLWLRSGPYVNLLFTGYTARERGRLRARTLVAMQRRDGKAARRTMEEDVGRALDYLAARVGSLPAGS